MLFDFIIENQELQPAILEEIKKEIYINKKELEDIDAWEISNESKE